ncbi:fatty-acyl-CoA synthase [Burkholderiales bacterium]|nr:fatty-acyl-CoA synthase [Burkholderiales bacterium]
MNIADPIRRHARTIPHAPACIRHDRVVSYAQFDRTIDAVARRALDLGLAAGDHVGVCYPDHPGSGAYYRFLVTALALARIGIAVKSTEGGEEGLVACFSPDAGRQGGPSRWITVDDAWFDGPDPSHAAPQVESHAGGTAICRIFSTSGTTGTAKCVAVSHDLMFRRIRDDRQLGPYPVTPIVIVHVGPWAGVGFRHALRALWTGGALVPARLPAQIFRAIARHRVNCMLVAPATLSALVEAAPDDRTSLSSLKSIEVTGSSLPRPLFEEARRRLCPSILSSYGSTEAGNVAWSRVSDLEGRPDAVGYVVPGQEVEAVDDDDRPLPAGTVGILRIRGATCADGYFRDEEASARTFRGGWFYPGDLGSVSADGLLTIAGRVSEVINIGGSKFSPRVVEEALLTVSGIVDAGAFGLPDALGIPSVCAAIVTRGTLATGALEAVCRGLDYAAPRSIVRLAQIPRNENGKILRAELARLAGTQGQHIRTASR